MAKRSNVFAQDFQTITRSADDAVFEFLKQGQQKEIPKEELTPKIVEVTANPEPEAVIVKADEKAEIESVEEKAERKNRSRAERSERTAMPKERVSAKPKEWGRPTALFNTRISEELSQSLDDLVYLLRKQRTPKTKQQLANEALIDLLDKHSEILASRLN